MPTTPLKNWLYRAALPVMAPSCHKQITHTQSGHALNHLPYYEHLLVHHHVFGASLLLQQGDDVACVDSSTRSPRHVATPDTMFRVASITKMATTLVTLRCIDSGLFALDTPVATLLPNGDSFSALHGVTVRQLLCHTSGLRDLPDLDASLQQGLPFSSQLQQQNIQAAAPGKEFRYSNFGFGLLGCILEHTTNQCIEALFQQQLFQPLGMRATLDGSTLNEEQLMPIIRVLPYHPEKELRVTALGRIPLTQADPMHHYGHTAGAMYTNTASLARMLTVIAQHGQQNGLPFISAALMREMTTLQATSPTRQYGLGLCIRQMPAVSDHRILGHQGFAYGCVDGAFFEEDTGRMVIFLNGGASEARSGKFGLVNRDVLTWALGKEMPSWT